MINDQSIIDYEEEERKALPAPAGEAQLSGSKSCAPKGCGFCPWSRAHTYVSGSIPSLGTNGRQLIDVSLSLPLSLSPSP